MKTKIRSDMILKELAKRHANDAFFTEVKNGPTQTATELLRIDALAIKKSWAHPLFTGYEVKVDRQDFLWDDKWYAYKKYCHRLYFACPTDMIKPEEIPEDVGLIYYNPETGALRVKRRAVTREIEIPWEMLYYLIICRLESDRHPFFSSRRELLEAWVEDKTDKINLGNKVHNRMTKKIKEYQRIAEKAEREMESQKDDLQFFERVKRVMVRFGVGTYRWDIEKSLEKALGQGMAPNMTQSLQVINREVNRLLATVGEKQKAVNE